MGSTARRASVVAPAGDRRNDERGASAKASAISSVRLAKSDDDASSPARLREPSLKKKGRSGGGIRIALGAAGKSLEVVGAWGLRSQDRLPPQLGNGMTLDLTDALCGDTPDRTDISELGLTAVDESIAAANDVGGALVQ